jgi:hypothetical protein
MNIETVFILISLAAAGYTALVFAKTVLLTAVTGVTAWAALFVLMLPVDPAVAQPIANIGVGDVTSVHIVVLLLLTAAWIASRHLRREATRAFRRYKKALQLA